MHLSRKGTYVPTYLRKILVLCMLSTAVSLFNVVVKFEGTCWKINQSVFLTLNECCELFLLPISFSFFFSFFSPSSSSFCSHFVRTAFSFLSHDSPRACVYTKMVAKRFSISYFLRARMRYSFYRFLRATFFPSPGG